MTARPIVFLDTETNGLHAGRRPWEIAWIRREPDGTESETCIHISDVDNTNADPKALQIGRFHERWQGRNFPALAGGGYAAVEGDPIVMPEWRAAEAVEQDTRDAIIVGSTPNFDTETLAAMLRRHRLCPAWHYKLIDIATLAAGWLRAVPDSAPIVQNRKKALASWNELTEQQRRVRDDQAATTIERNRIDERVTEAAEKYLAADQELRDIITPPWRSDDLSRLCGVEPPTKEERHTALGDARWVKRWYDHIIGGAA